LNERSMGKIEPRLYDVETPILFLISNTSILSISTRSLHFAYTIIDHNLCHAVHCLKVSWRSQWWTIAVRAKIPKKGTTVLSSLVPRSSNKKRASYFFSREKSSVYLVLSFGIG
jgi:hypothetical protein